MKITLIILLAVQLCACERVEINGNDAIVIADMYVENNLNETSIGMRREVSEYNDIWIVRYFSDPPYPGGERAIAVDKDTGEANIFFQSQ